MTDETIDLLRAEKSLLQDDNDRLRRLLDQVEGFDHSNYDLWAQMVDQRDAAIKVCRRAAQHLETMGGVRMQNPDAAYRTLMSFLCSLPDE